MMTSSNGNIFRVTAHLCREFTGEFHAQRPVTPTFDVFFDLRLNIRLSKQSWGWWFETPSRSLWRNENKARQNFTHIPWSILYTMSGCPSLGSRTPVHGFDETYSRPRAIRPFDIRMWSYITLAVILYSAKIGSVVLKCVKHVPQNVLKRFGNYF